MAAKTSEKSEAVTRLAGEAVARAEAAARQAEAAAAAAADALATLRDAPAVVPVERRAPLPVSGTAHGDGADLVVESVAGGVRVTLGKESTVLDAAGAVVARRKLDQAAALL